MTTKKDAIFNLNDDELALAKAKNTDANRLGFAVLMKYFQLENHYPRHIKFIDPFMLDTLSNQLNISPTVINQFDWEGRSTERFRQEIRTFLGYRKANNNDISHLKAWLFKNIFPQAVKRPQRIEHAYVYFRENKIEPLASKELERRICSAHREFEQQLFESMYSQLNKKTKWQMTQWLADNPDDNDNNGDNEEDDESEIKFKHLKIDIPGAKLKNVSRAMQKINCLKQLNLPEGLISEIPEKLIKKYYVRVMAERPSDMRKHSEQTRYAIFSLFCYFRSQLLIDSLADLFMKLAHQLETKSENFVDKKILSEVKCVNGKFDILYKLSVSALENPTGIIQEKIYPEVGQETLSNLVKELYFKGKWYQTQVHIKMHSLYSHTNRIMLLTLLDGLSLKTNSPGSKPLLEAIHIMKCNRDSSSEYYPNDVDVPVKNVVPHEWLDLVITSSENGTHRINRINYELSVLQQLKKQLGCKTIWVEGAFRYRNPDRDLPKDFDERRDYYYGLLGLPLNAKEFTAPQKEGLHNSLSMLNENILQNKKVEIINKKDGGHIKISPYDPQAEPANIKKLHQTIKRDYGMINLIDVLKESDLQIGLTHLIQTVASRENIPREVLQFRILLCLYAIGTNTGLKCLSSANESVSYDDLRYVKRRFITVENVRLILVEIINRILEIRDPRIWGEATTSVACDSKKISVWDQNLMVEWHRRYRGRGVMVYWHVDENALCIYSQLKTCSSSEVGAMLKGILQHCTHMEINQVHSDTHGQSTLAFGVSELLDFDLLPRLKNIHSQKLYYPSPSHKSSYENLELILKEPIHWKLIEEQYDEAIKHIIALKIGTMEPDVFVKRFSRDNYQHPVYKAIMEIGKVSKTNFLCRCLMSEELRIEIHEAQNVVERLNSVMGFIFYGKMGEISTNIKEYQELGIVCLHLLQACMAYINTLIFQKVLSRPEWQNVLTPEDKRALNVLFHSHINPYGLFPLDLKKRLGIVADALEMDKSDEDKAILAEEIYEKSG